MDEIDQDLINTRGSCDPPGEKPLMRYDWEKGMLVPIEPEREPVPSLAWGLIAALWLLLVLLGMG